MRIFKITKYYRGGAATYFATMPRAMKMGHDNWENQLHDWGEGTSGGHNYGYSIRVTQVTKFPKGRKGKRAPRLRFNPDYLEKKHA